jgi:hypothetical protein
MPKELRNNENDRTNASSGQMPLFKDDAYKAFEKGLCRDHLVPAAAAGAGARTDTYLVPRFTNNATM